MAQDKKSLGVEAVLNWLAGRIRTLQRRLEQLEKKEEDREQYPGNFQKSLKQEFGKLAENDEKPITAFVAKNLELMEQYAVDFHTSREELMQQCAGDHQISVKQESMELFAWDCQKFMKKVTENYQKSMEEYEGKLKVFENDYQKYMDEGLMEKTIQEKVREATTMQQGDLIQVIVEAFREMAKGLLKREDLQNLMDRIAVLERDKETLRSVLQDLKGLLKREDLQSLMDRIAVLERDKETLRCMLQKGGLQDLTDRIVALERHKESSVAAPGEGLRNRLKRLDARVAGLERRWQGDLNDRLDEIEEMMLDEGDEFPG